MNPLSEDGNEETGYSSFVSTANIDHKLTIHHSYTPSHPVSFSQAVGLRRESVDESCPTETENWMIQGMKGGVDDPCVETSSVTTSL
jgi:hypothetical protein